MLRSQSCACSSRRHTVLIVPLTTSAVGEASTMISLDGRFSFKFVAASRLAREPRVATGARKGVRLHGPLQEAYLPSPMPARVGEAATGRLGSTQFCALVCRRDVHLATKIIPHVGDVGLDVARWCSLETARRITRHV